MRIACALIVAVSLLPRRVEAPPGRSGTLHREGVRVVGAFAALLAAALLLTAGLLWRENARARPHPATPTPVVSRH
jgi:hypothetical protein